MSSQINDQPQEAPLLPKLRLQTKVYWKYLMAKQKFKKISFDKEKLTINFFIGLAFFSILIGLIIFVVFLYKLSKQYSIGDNKIALEKTAQVGDFIGGIVGAIWALTGVLLFYATLRLQSKELAENRKHFQMSRLTDIIYKQLDLFNQQLVNFKLKDIERDNEDKHIIHTGKAAIALLRHRVESISDVEKKQHDNKEKATLRFIAENFAFIELNKNSLLNIYEELGNQVDVIRSVLIKEDIPPADLNELKSIFFRNIGKDFLNGSELFEHFLEWYITYKKKQGTIENEFFSPEYAIKLKISEIGEFRKKRYDKKNIQDYLRSREIYNDTNY